MPKADLQSLLLETKRVVQQAVEFIDEERKKGFQVKEKSRNSLVTRIDEASERILVEGLSKILPEAGIIGEEGTGDRSNQSLNWIIDPLDGTTNFIHGIPCYCVSVALVADGEEKLGIVHEVNLNDCFTALQSGGAFWNDDQIFVSENKEMKDALFATGFPYYDFEHAQDYLNLLNDFMVSSRGIRRLGSAAVDLAYVACGKFDGFYEYSLSPWDVAAGALIVKEAGGVVTDFSGGNNYLFGKEIVASSTSIQRDFLNLIQRHFSP